MKCKREEQVCEITSRMWARREWSDATVQAGKPPGPQRCFNVRRAVLASRSEFFERAFGVTFRESPNASVKLPEDPTIVEAVLEHIYIGGMPAAADPVQLLPLAHRLELRDRVIACAEAISTSPTTCGVDAVRALAPLVDEEPAVRAAWGV